MNEIIKAYLEGIQNSDPCSCSDSVHDCTDQQCQEVIDYLKVNNLDQYLVRPLWYDYVNQRMREVKI